MYEDQRNFKYCRIPSSVYLGLKSKILNFKDRFDQGHFHPLLDHLETNMSRSESDPGICNVCQK